MIALFLENVRIDDMAQIAKHFDEEQLKAAVKDNSLEEWLDEGGEEAALKRVRAMGGTGGGDFAERLIAALWPDEGSAEAQAARAHLAETRKRAAEQERRRQEREAEEERKRAKEEKRRKEREERAAAAAARKEAEAPDEPDVITVDFLRHRVRKEAPWAACFKVKQIRHWAGGWILDIGLLDVKRRKKGTIRVEGGQYAKGEIRNGKWFNAANPPQGGRGGRDGAEGNLPELLAAAQEGDKDAQWRYGCRLLDRGELPSAATWFRRAAEQKHAEARVFLGHWFLGGEGDNSRPSHAFLWYWRAARQGNAEGEYCTGMCYRYGHGVDINEERAEGWLRKAAEQGHRAAKKELAHSGESGLLTYAKSKLKVTGT